MTRLRAIVALALVACGQPAATEIPLFVRPGDVLCGAGCSDDSCRDACPSGLDCFANGTGPQARNVCLTSDDACSRIGCARPKECVTFLPTGPIRIGCIVER